MSRKKNSESVEEILESVRAQTAQSLAKSAASDSQVDQILAELGLGNRPAAVAEDLPDRASFTPAAEQEKAAVPQPEPERRSNVPARRGQTALTVQSDPVSSAAEKSSGAGTFAAESRVSRDRQPRRESVREESRPVTRKTTSGQSGRVRSDRFSTTANLPKTASEVQSYFLKTSPADELEDPTLILRREQQFRDFFQESVAVIPDSGKDRPVLLGGEDSENTQDKTKKKARRGFFGFGRRAVIDEETGEILIPAELNQKVEPEFVRPEPERRPQPEQAKQEAPIRQEPAGQPAANTKESPDAGGHTGDTGTISVRPGVKHQGTIAFPYARTVRSTRTHIKTIEFEPTPRRTRRRAPDITMNVRPPRAGDPAQQENYQEEQRRAAAQQAAYQEEQRRAAAQQAAYQEEQRRATAQQAAYQAKQSSAAEEEVLTPPPQNTDEMDVGSMTRMGLDTGAIKLNFANRIADAINNDTVGYQANTEAVNAAHILMDPDAALDEEAAPPPEQKKKFRLFGKPKEETDTAVTSNFVEEEPEEEQVDDYNRVEDAPLIRADLLDMVFRLRVRGVIGGFLALLLLVLDITTASGIVLISALDPATAPQAFLAVNLILLLITCVLNHATLLDGIISFRGDPSPDTICLLACLSSAVQTAVYLAVPSLYDPLNRTLFTGVAALLISLNAFGKSLTGDTVSRNFDLVSSGVDHVAAYPLRDEALQRRLCSGLDERRPCLLVSRPTPLVKGFIKNSFSPRQSDRVAQNCAMILLITAVLSTVINLVVKKDVGMALSVFPAVICLGAPLCATFVSAIPEMKMHQSAARVGAVIPGWASIKQLGRVNIVQITANDLFPAGCVSLHGIKTFEKERIDKAILYAASILVEGCGTLQEVFLNILQNNRELLLPVENLTTELGGGFVGWIQNNRVIVGNRSLMEKYDIEVPSLEYEKRFTQGGRKPIYLAVAGKLFGMFIVSYAPNSRVKATVDSLHKGGISLLVSSEDFSVDAELVENTYGLPQGSVKVLNAQESEDLSPHVSWLPESEGCMIHLGKFASFVGGLRAASGAAAGERSASMVMILSVVISSIISLVLSVNGGNAAFLLPAMLLYQAFWSIASLIFPLAIQKY